MATTAIKLSGLGGDPSRLTPDAISVAHDQDGHRCSRAAIGVGEAVSLESQRPRLRPGCGQPQPYNLNSEASLRCDTVPGILAFARCQTEEAGRGGDTEGPRVGKGCEDGASLVQTVGAARCWRWAWTGREIEIFVATIIVRAHAVM